MKNLVNYKSIFGKDFKGFFEVKKEYYTRITQEPIFHLAFDQLEKIATNGGKRIRPYFVNLLAGEDKNKDIELAIELFHIFCLVHDDIMDKSDRRRDLQTIHNLFLEKYQTEERLGDLQNVSNAQAILIGDMVFAWVMELISFAKINDVVKKIFLQMIDQVMIGQMIDVDSTTLVEQSEEVIIEKMYLKTASYTFVKPMQIGAAMGSVSKENLQKIEDFGRHLGIAFQTQDDLLEIEHAEDQIGKDSFNDIKEGQHTILTNYIFSKKDKNAEKLKDFFGKDFESSKNIELKEIFKTSGAIEYANSFIEEEFKKAETALQNLEVSFGIKEDLKELVESLKTRTF